jgi:hypothetical protein
VPVTLTPPEVTPSPAVELDNGVIEEARRRQRRRRTAGIALGTSAVMIAISALLIGGGGSGNSGAPGEPPPDSPLKLTLLHGRAFLGGRPALMGITPSLQAGNVGVCVRVIMEGSCNGPPPSAADPIYGGEGGFRAEEKVGPDGEIDAIFTGPGVAAMRVAHLGTFKAQSVPGLPPGAKQIVFYRPPGSRGSVLGPGLSPRILQGFERARHGPALTETLLDASGHTIPVGKSQTFTLPNSYWQGTQAPPAQGRCTMSSSLPGVRTEWGQVATKIAPDHAITTPAWLTCLHTWFSLKGASYETAILLNAHSPGSFPAMLWGAIPLSGHPGVVQIPAVQREIHFRIPKLTSAQTARELAQDTKIVGRKRAETLLRQVEQAADKEQTYWEVLIPPTVARRVGPAWVLVRYGNSLAERIGFLDALHVTFRDAPGGNRTPDLRFERTLRPSGGLSWSPVTPGRAGIELRRLRPWERGCRDSDCHFIATLGASSGTAGRNQAMRSDSHARTSSWSALPAAIRSTIGTSTSGSEPWSGEPLLSRKTPIRKKATRLFPSGSG